MSVHPSDEALASLLARGRASARAGDAAQDRLWEGVTAAAEGGKRFRPALVTATHDALAGNRPSDAAMVGAALELLHTAFVIHDDVIDGDDVRRGRLNVSGTFTSQALVSGVSQDLALGLGRAAGILAGDLALSAAIGAVARIGAPSEVVHRLLDLFDAALHTTAAGELADVGLALWPGTASLRESLAMEEQKTSAYSFTLPLQAGAVLADADDGVVDRLGEAGRVIGIAFQLLDDVIGVFGDPAETGKSATSDLRTSKQTPLLVHATATPQGDQIRSYVGRELVDHELAEVRLLLEAAGSRRFVEDLAQAHLSEAQAVLEGLGIAGDLMPTVTACLSLPHGGIEAVA